MENVHGKIIGTFCILKDRPLYSLVYHFFICVILSFLYLRNLIIPGPGVPSQNGRTAGRPTTPTQPQSNFPVQPQTLM